MINKLKEIFSPRRAPQEDGAHKESGNLVPVDYFENAAPKLRSNIEKFDGLTVNTITKL